jgi:nucleoside-diphosphate-sugar epimerase
MASPRRVLVTGATGALGSEVVHQLAGLPHLAVQAVSRRGDPASGTVGWDMAEPPPPALAGPWDVVVNCAASTRWTATPAEAHRANVASVESLLALVGPSVRFVHVSTAFVQHDVHDPLDLSRTEPEDYRNPYEWSKAIAEVLLRRRHGDLHVVRPPLILGRRGDGSITRFAGTYSLLGALTSGLAAAVIGDPAARVELAPVDQVAERVIAAIDPGAGSPALDVIAAGTESVSLGALIAVACEELNTFRAVHGVAPIDQPPFVPTESWQRFFLPLAQEWLSHRQLQALEVLEAFRSYTAQSITFDPTTRVEAPDEVLRRSVRHWAATHQRPALRTPRPWSRRAGDPDPEGVFTSG